MKRIHKKDLKVLGKATVFGEKNSHALKHLIITEIVRKLVNYNDHLVDIRREMNEKIKDRV